MKLNTERNKKPIAFQMICSNTAIYFNFRTGLIAIASMWTVIELSLYRLFTVEYLSLNLNFFL